MEILCPVCRGGQTMKERSENFDSAIRGNFKAIASAQLYVNGQYVDDLPVLSGSWTDDNTADIRSRCEMELRPDPDLIPAKNFRDDKGLWPSGSEIQVNCGISARGMADELLPVGRFVIIDASVSEDEGGSLKLNVSGQDRSSKVSRGRFDKAITLAAGTDVASAIKLIVISRIHTMTLDDMDFVVTDGSDGGRVYRLPVTTIAQTDDPWSVCKDMAASIGADLFFDGTGRCVLRWINSGAIQKTVDWDYSEGEGSNLLSASRVLSADGAYNGVIASSSSTESADLIYGAAWDTDVNSPTYYDPAIPQNSYYGPYPYFYSSEFITTNEQAVGAARGMFANVCGLSEKMSFGAIMHPAQEVGDRVLVKRDRINVNDVMVIDSLSRGIGSSGKMSVTAKARRVLTVAGFK